MYIYHGTRCAIDDFDKGATPPPLCCLHPLCQLRMLWSTPGPEHMPKRMSERLPDRMSEHMTERM